jgi:hypothetical protein
VKLEANKDVCRVMAAANLTPNASLFVREGLTEDEANEVTRKARNKLKALRKSRSNPRPKGLRTDIPRATFEEVAKIRRQLAMLDDMPCGDPEPKDAVRSKLLARLKELGA